MAERSPAKTSKSLPKTAVKKPPDKPSDKSTARKKPTKPSRKKAENPKREKVKKRGILPWMVAGIILCGVLGGGGFVLMQQGAIGTKSSHGRKQKAVTSRFEVPTYKYGVEIVGWKKPQVISGDKWLDILDKDGAGKLQADLSDWLIKKSLPNGTLEKSLLKDVMADSSYRLLLRRHEILRGVSVPKVDAIMRQPQGREFLHYFLSSPEWMDDMLASGPIGSYSATLERLFLIYKYDKECTVPLYRKLATAVALQSGGSKYNVLSMFQEYKNAHKQGILHMSFEGLDTREMRFIIIHWGPDELKSLFYDRNYQSGRYWGACWACAYKTYNRYGDSIQTPHYYQPWVHVYDNAMRGRREGGVCGTLSTFGSVAARAHGILATAAGEPGHCAYVVRNLDKVWKRAYHIANPTRPKSYFWYASVSFLQLMEKVYANRDAVIKAREYTWQANLLRSKYMPRVAFPIDYKVYAGTWSRLPDFSKLEAVKEGQVNDFNYRPLVAGVGNFAIEYSGKLVMGDDREVSFNLRSDDGSRLLIDDKIVINNDGQHPAINKSAKQQLLPGEHTFRILYFDSGGGNALGFSMQTSPSEEALAVYQLAVESWPIHYGIQQEYLNLLSTKKDVSPDIWRKATELICKAFGREHDPAWRLLNDKPLRALAEVPASEKLSRIIGWHNALDLNNPSRVDSSDFIRILNQQADCIGEQALQLEFSAKLLEHYKNYGGYFATVYSWANNRFGSNPKTAAGFLEVLEGFLEKSGDDVSGGGRGILASAIKSVEKSSNIEAFQKLSKLAADKFMITSDYKLLNFSKKAADKFPVAEPFSGELLSQYGLLQSSSEYGGLSPLSHHAVLCDKAPGGIILTQEEVRPWIQLVLAGPSKLSGIVLVNRYEDYQNRQVPMTITVSSDGKQWKEVTKLDKVQPVWRVSLENNQDCDRVRYIRVMVDHGSNKKYFHLRGFRVYGTKLY